MKEEFKSKQITAACAYEMTRLSITTSSKIKEALEKIYTTIHNTALNGGRSISIDNFTRNLKTEQVIIVHKKLNELGYKISNEGDDRDPRSCPWTKLSW